MILKNELMNLKKSHSFILLIYYFFFVFLIIFISTFFIIILLEPSHWNKAGIILQIIGAIFLSIWAIMGKDWGAQQIPNILQLLKPKKLGSKSKNFWIKHRRNINRFLTSTGFSLLISGLIVQLLS